MTTDLDHNMDDVPRRRFGAAFFCLLCLGIAVFAYFFDEKPVFGLLFGGLSLIGCLYYLLPIHSVEGADLPEDQSDDFFCKVDTCPSFASLPSNIHHKPEPSRIRDD